MEMQQVRYFLALSQTLNFTRAAEECNVTQPALTRAIQALEAELGGELIRRERQRSHLTELGQRMLPLLQQCYDAARSAQALARAGKSSDVAPLSLAISRTVNMEILLGPLGELFGAYPGARLKIRRGTGSEILQLLKEGHVELAVAGPLGESWERLDTWELFSEPFELAFNVDHRLGRKNDDISLEELAGERILGLVGCEMAGALLSQLRAHGIAEENTHEVESDHDLLALLTANAGIGFVPYTAPTAPQLRRARISALALSRSVSVYAVAGRRRAPVATSLLNLFRASEWPESEASLPAAGR